MQLGLAIHPRCTTARPLGNLPTTTSSVRLRRPLAAKGSSPRVQLPRLAARISRLRCITCIQAYHSAVRLCTGAGSSTTRTIRIGPRQRAVVSLALLGLRACVLSAPLLLQIAVVKL